MEIKDLKDSTNYFLKMAQEKLDDENYKDALMFARKACDESSKYYQHIWRRLRNAALEAQPPGENVR